jgi:hypothetical protein
MCVDFLTDLEIIFNFALNLIYGILMKKRILRILVGLLWALIGSVIAGFFGILISILTGNGLSIGTQPRTIETQIIGTSQIIGAVISASLFIRQGWSNSDFYRYDVIQVDALKAFSRATPKRDDLKSFVAGISKMNDGFSMIVCGSRNNSKNIQNPILDRTSWNCGQDSEKISEKVSS